MIAILIGATLTVFVRDSWPLYSFCIAVMLMLAVIASKRQLDRVSLFPLLIPAFGLLQLALSSTAYAPSTRVAALRWFALAGVLMIAEFRLAADRQRRDRFLDQFVAFAAFAAVLCLLQLHSSQGKVLWYFNTGYSDVVYGFFPSRNNYGQFVELALAVALCRAMTDKTRGFWFGLASALLYASAIASTSRGAAVLTTLELLIVPAITLWRSRKASIGHAILLFAGVIAMAVCWTTVSGWDATWNRFREPDAYQGRREFSQSALQMARERPLLGQGLDSFAQVYPRFARVDSPEIVTHAHNDWAEFAADGGFVFALLIFGLFASAIPRMVRHPWSLGLLFVMVHAVVDYPFPRVAVSGWLFALLGALPVSRQPAGAATRSWMAPLGVAACCVFGLYWSTRLAMADVFFSRDTIHSIRRAIDLVPDEARYYSRLAQLYDSTNVRPILERALQLNPRDAETLIDVGFDAELHNEFPLAEASLLKAAQVNATWLPRWTLANYYFRRSDTPQFWHWAAEAIAVSHDRRDVLPLFKMAAKLDAEPAKILAILPSRAAPLRRLVAFELESRQTQVLEEIALRLLDCGTPGNDRPYILWAIEGFLSNHKPEGAIHLWAKLKERRWIASDAGVAFADPPLQSSLDWRYLDVNGVTRSRGPDGRLRFDFSGQQPEQAPLIERFAAVRTHLKQRFEWGGSQSSDGVQWEVHSLSGEMLGSSTLDAGRLEFTPPDSIVRVRLTYQRAPGKRRIEGTVELTPPRVVELPEQQAWAGSQSSRPHP